MSAGAAPTIALRQLAPPRRSLLRGGLPPWAWCLVLFWTLACDRAVYLNLALIDPITQTVDAALLRSFEGKDWFRLLRVMGWLGTWILLGVALLLIDVRRYAPRTGRTPWTLDAAREWARRGVFIVACAGLSGAAAEGVKFLVGLRRPGDTRGHFEFMWPLGERLANWNDLGMASSHAAVAFGAAMALALMYPAAAPVYFLVALGCGLTRVLAGAHFLSDVLVAAWIAYAVSLAVWRVDARNNRDAGLGRTLSIPSHPTPGRHPSPRREEAPAA